MCKIVSHDNVNLYLSLIIDVDAKLIQAYYR